MGENLTFLRQSAPHRFRAGAPSLTPRDCATRSLERAAVDAAGLGQTGPIPPDPRSDAGAGLARAGRNVHERPRQPDPNPGKPSAPPAQYR